MSKSTTVFGLGDKILSAGPEVKIPGRGKTKISTKFVAGAAVLTGLVIGPLSYLGDNENSEPQDLIAPTIDGGAEGLGVAVGALLLAGKGAQRAVVAALDYVNLEEIPDAADTLYNSFVSEGFSDGVGRFEDFSVEINWGNEN
jgi:hypothetical protein